MRLILRILAAPVVGVLALVTAFCSFALAVSGVILGIVSVIVFVLEVVTFFTNTAAMGIAWMAVAFLISPFGLTRLAGWLIDKLDNVNCALKDFIFG